MTRRLVRLLPLLLLCSFAFASMSCAPPGVAHASEPTVPFAQPAADDVQADDVQADDVALPATEPNAPPAAVVGESGVLAFAVDHGMDALGWAFALLASAGSWVLLALGFSVRVRGVFAEVGAYARRAVLDTWATYVKDIKAARADGRLTDEEKAFAKQQAMAQLRTALSWGTLLALGGGLLRRIFAGSTWAARLEEALGGAVEAAVTEAKQEGRAAGLVTKGTKVDAVGLPLRAPKEAPPLPPL